MNPPGVLQAKHEAAFLPADWKGLTRDLRSDKASVRTNAEEWLRKMDVPGLLALMAYERQQRKQRRKQMGLVLAVYLVLLPVLLFWVRLPTILPMFYYLIGPLAAARAFTKSEKFGAMTLAAQETPAAVGELVAALEMQDADVRHAVLPALTRLLPQLRDSDSGLLGEHERRVLRLFMENKLFGRPLRKQRDTVEEQQMILAALKALEQVGDVSFIPMVTRWAEGEKRGADPRIRQAATECLPFLEQSSLRRREGQELLRASGQDYSIQADELLRPVSSSQTATEGLLRPSAMEISTEETVQTRVMPGDPSVTSSSPGEDGIC